MIKSNTCLAVIKNKKGKLVMAGDRRCSWGMHQSQKLPWPKVVKRNNFLLAGTGDAYICDIMTKLLPVEPDKNLTDYMYMNQVLFEEAKDLLVSKSLKKGELPNTYTEILIGYNSKLYVLDMHIDEHKKKSEFQLLEVDTPYATGCGGHLAWGSLLTTEKWNMPPKDRLITALKVAAVVSPGCDDNIDIIEED